MEKSGNVHRKIRESSWKNGSVREISGPTGQDVGRSIVCQEAMDEAQKFFAVLEDDEVAEALGHGYSSGDYRKAMHTGAAVLAGRARHSFVSSVRIARLYAHAGENRKAIEWLEKACEQRASPLIHLAVARDWDPLRSDPRFKGLLQHVGLPEE